MDDKVQQMLELLGAIAVGIAHKDWAAAQEAADTLEIMLRTEIIEGD